MRKIFKSLFVNSLVLFLVVALYDGLVYDQSLQTLFWAAVVLWGLNKTIRPMIKLLLLPINVLTLGVFGWVAHVITLFLVTQLVVGFEVAAFYFSGFNQQGFVIPGMQVSLLFSYILASVFISLVKAAVLWLISD